MISVMNNMSPWFLRSMDTKQLRILFLDDIYNLCLEFYELPTIVFIKKELDGKVCVFTDGKFYKLDEQDSLDDYHNVPEGQRYGTFANINGVIMYKENFWDYQNVAYKNNDKPYMLKLRPMIIKPYFI